MCSSKNTVSLKREIRREVLHRRRRLKDEELMMYSKIINDKLREVIPEDSVTALFYPIQNEVDLRGLLQKGDLLPVIREAGLKMCEYTGELRNGKYNIPEPTGQEKEATVVIVPGSAFDTKGYRIGYGGGYYDRYLKDEHLKIGVCFEFQIVDEVPTESHDVKLDLLITEKNIYKW